MKKIEDHSEIKEGEFSSLIEQITQKLQHDTKASEVDAVDAIIDILAFKYWQENMSVEVNASLESSDYCYVQQHWNMFCKYSIGKLLDHSELYCRGERLSKNRTKQIATYAGQLSRYITHRNFDYVNAKVIKRWLKDHSKAINDGGLDKKANALIKVYRRGN